MIENAELLVTLACPSHPNGIIRLKQRSGVAFVSCDSPILPA
jgi:hypothetical protein